MIVDGYTTPGTERETVCSAGDLLAEMGRAGVQQALIAPQDREIAVDNILGNDRILKLASASSARLIPACTANPWYGPAAIKELRRAVSGGARMLVLAPALQGFILSDELSDDLLNESAAMNLPVYIHTGPHSSSTPTQLALVAHRHPQCRFILGHGGSTDYSHDMPSVLEMRLANIWLELSFVRPWAVGRYASLIDESKLIFGSSCPRNDMGFELNQFNQHWPIADHPATYGRNLLKLIAEAQP